MDSKTFYKCNPIKNIQCPKTHCLYNKASKEPKCSMTSHKEFSLDDKEVQLAVKEALESMADELCNEIINGQGIGEPVGLFHIPPIK